MSSKKIVSHTRLYDTDVAARKIWLSLLRDFRSTEGPGFARKAEEQFLKGVPEFRQYSFPELGLLSPSRYKRWLQLANLFKKYRFAKDLYTDDELNDKTLDGFMSEQIRLATYKPTGMLAKKVIQRARWHAKRILGEFNPEAVIPLAKFGKKSSIGCPLSLAYIDEKLSNVKAFTGSSECASWFYDKLLPGDPVLKGMVDALGITRDAPQLNHESLNLVQVPKAWNKYRPITPLTLLSLFYSYGVGDLVDQALVKEGLNIRTLQEKHRKVVKWMSVECNYSTADLVGASNSLLSWLLNGVLPRKWYRAMQKTFARTLVVKRSDGESVCYTESVLPMGNALTFPVETLVFYVLLKAIADLTNVKGFISVYGDDLIYPSKLHQYVAVLFPQLGLKLNLDKTYVNFPFRESCGSDFYRGVDVRPFFLPDEHQMLTRSKYVAWLYKCYNGLLRRFDELEVRSTLYTIMVEIAMTGIDLYRVPPSFPDTAGIKVESPDVVPLDSRLLPWRPVLCRFLHGSRWFEFDFFAETPDRRQVKAVMPYYWLALQNRTDTPTPYNKVPCKKVRRGEFNHLLHFNERLHGYKVCRRSTPSPRFWFLYQDLFADPPVRISWDQITVPRVRYRKGRKVNIVEKKSIPTVPDRNKIRFGVHKAKAGSISDWI